MGVIISLVFVLPHIVTSVIDELLEDSNFYQENTEVVQCVHVHVCMLCDIATYCTGRYVDSLLHLPHSQKGLNELQALKTPLFFFPIECSPLYLPIEKW